MGLTREATIADVLGTLAKPDPYLCGVLQNMWKWKKVHGRAYVSIGTTGDGVAPHYRIGPSSNDLDAAVKAGGEKDVDALFAEYIKHCRAFHGTSHKRLEWGVFELKNQHWSTRQMNYDEVQSLIGEPPPTKSARLLLRCHRAANGS